MGEALAEVADFVFPTGRNGNAGGQMLPAQRPQSWQHFLGQDRPKGSNPGKASARFGRHMSLQMNQE
jgi:hypothetical protein